MNTLEYIKDRFDEFQSADDGSFLNVVREKAFASFGRLGIPTAGNEEWKYTRIGSLFNRQYALFQKKNTDFRAADLNNFRLPGHETANEIVFVNGVYSAGLSHIRFDRGITVIPLEEAATGDRQEMVSKYFGHSGQYLKDGINALNTALVYGGVFIGVNRQYGGDVPVYVYNITDARLGSILSQPRSFLYLEERAEFTLVESYFTLGGSDSMTNQVMEVVVEKDARFDYYKIQNDASFASQVSTTHIRQIGKSFVNTVTVSLNGSIVRNNLHALLEAPHTEAHLYGLYFQKGNSHLDNHTVVDNVAPHCLSNELYKGIMDDSSTGVFNGKVFVRKDAQKTNAFQSNKNVLLSEEASINTKPQLEIFADDVKCSHGCTIGRLDEDALFYLRSRGIPHNEATALLLQGFAVDILNKIRSAPIRAYVEELIAQRLTMEA